MKFSDYFAYESIIDETAILVVEKGIDPQAINELADLYLEFNPLAMAGGALGAAAGGVPGAMIGSTIGQKVGSKVGQWFNKGRAQQINPAFQQAKQSVNNLLQTINSVAPNSTAASNMVTKAQQLQAAIQGIEPDVQPVDQELATAHDTQSRNAGGIAQKLQGNQSTGAVGDASRWLGQQAGKFDMFNKQGGVRNAITGMGDKYKQWAQKYPNLSKGLEAGGAIGAGYLMGRAMQGLSNHGQHPQPDAQQSTTQHAPNLDSQFSDNGYEDYTHANKHITSQKATSDEAGEWLGQDNSNSSGHYQGNSAVSHNPGIDSGNSSNYDPSARYNPNATPAERHNYVKNWFMNHPKRRHGL